MDELLLRLVDVPKFNGTLVWVSGRCYEYKPFDKSWIRQRERDDGDLSKVLLCSGSWRLDPALETALVLQLAIINKLNSLASKYDGIYFSPPEHFDPFWGKELNT